MQSKRLLMICRWLPRMLFWVAPGWAMAQGPTTPSVAAPGASVAAKTGPQWIQVPRLAGRLSVADIGLVINTADPYSVAVGEHYMRRRELAPAQVLRVKLPPGNSLTVDDFERLRDNINAHFGRKTQALALAWTAPYAVECNSITGALALGFDAELCKQSCAASKVSRYFNSPSMRPLADVGWRPSMLLAAPSVEQAKALIDRGVASDSSLARRGRPNVNAMLLQTDDAARRVRMVLYPPAGDVGGLGVTVKVVPAAELAAAQRVFLVITGSVTVNLSPPPEWLPGGLGDHLTSVGGALYGSGGQSTVLEWIASGATASHGSVSEPCNHLQKFPHPQVLLLHYLQGATAIEAYWKSVAWPQQSLFVGEPLAAPFSPPLSRAPLTPVAPARAASKAASVPDSPADSLANSPADSPENSPAAVSPAVPASPQLPPPAVPP